MTVPPGSSASRRLAQEARSRFVEGVCASLPALDKALQDYFVELAAQTGTARDMQTRRDAWLLYQQHHTAWMQRVAQGLRARLGAAPAPQAQPSSRPNAPGLQFELLSDDVVENKIMASRMALTLAEQVALQWDTVRQRMLAIEGQELDAQDVLRAESLCVQLVEQWVKAGLQRSDLLLAVDPLQRELANLLQRVYQQVNVFFVEQGVTPQTDLRARVRRAPGAPDSGSAAVTGWGGAGGVHSGMKPPGGGIASQALAQTQQALAAATARAMQPTEYLPLPRMHPGMVPGRPSASGLLLGTTPLARARQRAQGVMGQLRRILSQPVAGYDASKAAPASAALAQALAMPGAGVARADAFYSGMATLVEEYHSPAAVVQVAGIVRERTAELKKKAETPGEKAIIEVVALMFQSILAEDRIPPAVRVWFARLQVPVLRVALAEPEFFSNIDHPARKLIDRMGACVMGFDATAINGSALEAEIRRVVQVIEQYPETGQRVFQLVYDEFEKFLARFLTEKQANSKIVSVAQQVEQKETLAIQYTIELRTMLRDMPVREEIRDFLFKTWAEVLALSAVRDGAQHAETVALKRAAADLVWAASAKPHRSDRAQVIQALPGLLQRLRQGLALLGVTGGDQDAQIKVLTDTLADAFLSKTAAIPQAHIEAMAKRLANLEDFISDTSLGDMPLSADNIEMMLGIDASNIHVVADNGAPVEDGAVAWARELQPGHWFTLDHNGSSARVQYVWHSERKQLHLFAAADGSSYLIQLRRLAAYLQSGLLVPQDEEGLTVRATRDALTKLDANPERLLG
ncbi:DUF1631 family protein [Acidovorax lacteus]|uniref:DUF1631 domain-containing protein n=1 Tax=Acidovorax lacteus TaxID=1924988 RepID=A0ABP8LBB0_9BURK